MAVGDGGGTWRECRVGCGTMAGMGTLWHTMERGLEMGEKLK